MASKRNKDSEQSRKRSAAGRQAPAKTPLQKRPAVKIGIGALIVGVLTWLTGGLSWQNALEWVKALVVAGGLALMIRWSIGEPFRIPSGSMEPTLHGDPAFLRGDRVFVNKFTYGHRFPLNRARIPYTKTNIHYMDKRVWNGQGPQRFDIVVFKTVEEKGDHATLVKRVIGLPGERIHIANGKVHVNGEALVLPDSLPDIHYTSNAGSYGIMNSDAYSLVPEGHYLVLGDNSGRSKDGRYWGWVPNEHILGRVSCIWWPIGRWRDFTGFSQTWWWRALVTVLGILIVVRLFFGRSWRVRFPTVGDFVRPGDHLYINRAVFGLPIPFTGARALRGRIPRRGEVVLYEAAMEDGSGGFAGLGRIAGLPGERVLIEGGRLLIEGSPVTEPPSLAEWTSSGMNTGPFGASKSKLYSLIPQDHYFVLAEEPASGAEPSDDESPAPMDSRSLGWVPYKNLAGTATAVWWPPTRWRRLKP